MHSTSFGVPIICVGNLAAGGTGKTPMINYLTRYYLSREIEPVILSRGYGRRTKGFRIADKDDNADTLGDEPFLFFRRWQRKATVAVGEDRVAAVKKLLDRFPDVSLILMDDGYQHRSLAPGRSILLTTFQQPFYDDFLLPAGNLREARVGASRADAVVVTKCPRDLGANRQDEIRKKIRRYASPSTEIFFSHIEYGEPVCFGKKEAWHPKVILVSGIANTGPLLQFLQETGIAVAAHLKKPDHHRYTEKDFGQIAEAYEKHPGSVILTTEKDFVKMSVPVFEPWVKTMPFFYIPLEFSFSKEKENFEAMLEKLVTANR